MHNVFWYGKKDRNCNGIWTADIDAASEVAHAMLRAGWRVVWMSHTSDGVEPYPREKWIAAHAQWLADRDS